MRTIFQGKMNKKLAEFQNEMMSKHCDEVENIYRQMRGWKHDFHNHIQVMKAFIAMDQIEELTAYCDQLDKDLTTVDQVIKTNNVMVDAVLNSKLSLAKAKSIEVDAKATVPSQMLITTVDLCVLIGNLLDNAIEACDQTQCSEDYEFDHPFIRVYIGTKGKQLYISVLNTVYTSINKKGGVFLSTKDAAKRGLGLMRIDKICNKYEGYCKRNSEPGAFSTEILLPIH